MEKNWIFRNGEILRKKVVRKYPRMKAFLTKFLGPKSTPSFVKCPKVDNNFTNKVHYMLKYALLELIWWKLLWKMNFPKNRDTAILFLAFFCPHENTWKHIHDFMRPAYASICVCLHERNIKLQLSIENISIYSSAIFVLNLLRREAWKRGCTTLWRHSTSSFSKSFV